MPNSNLRKILTFEIPSSTDWQAQGENSQFVPNYFVDITKYLEKKIKLLKVYKNEMRKWPHSRSFENVKFLAKTRGATVGCKAAKLSISAFDRKINFLMLNFKKESTIKY